MTTPTDLISTLLATLQAIELKECNDKQLHSLHNLFADCERQVHEEIDRRELNS